jgi:RNA polymerase sigma-70 factor (ECF subfamily)
VVSDANHLFAAHRDGVFRYLCRMVGRGAADELTQEVFLRVSRAPVPQADEGSARAWVFRIARNLALNHVRDTHRHGVMVDLPDHATPPTQELGAALRQALDALPTLDRDVFLMREAGGLAYDEIARACDMTADAVRSRLHRARQQLRAALGPSLALRVSSRGVRLYDRNHESG